MAGNRLAERVERLLASKNIEFLELVRLSGLSPETGFQFKDLRGLDLSNLDLSKDGFDFRNSDLSFCDLRGTKFAPGALHGASLEAVCLKDTWVGKNAFAPEGLPDFAVFRDNPMSPEMVVIPAGTFLMGSPDSDLDALDNEKPRHDVTISRRFALGRYPVTFEEYDAFCEETDREKPNDQGGRRGRYPVIGVSAVDAESYCRWLSKKANVDFRLPTEAEWEYACRARAQTRFSFGEDKSQLPEHAWFAGNSGGGVQMAGLKSPNRFGLYDMHGNVWEWCADLLSAYSLPHLIDPVDPRISGERVARGGSWYLSGRRLRAASRVGFNPSGRYDVLGFRCVRVL